MALPASLPSPPPSGRSVLIVGAGLVGLSCAWLLARRGHRVQLLAAEAGAPQRSTGAEAGLACGSEAALGVLMARVFHRSSGRGWRLRQRSLELWQSWRQELAQRDLPISWRQGLLLLASDSSDLERQRRLLEDPRRQPAALQFWDRQRLESLAPQLPAGALGGLHSPQDGQLEPLEAMRALAADGARAGIERCSGWAESLEPCGHGWRLRLRDGGHLESEWLVLAAGLGSTALLAGDRLPAAVPLQPVLGQALELELAAGDAPDALAWPGSVVWRGANLILRAPGPDATSPWRLWLGATLEPGRRASAAELASLRSLAGASPDWLARARVIRSWQGWRARPEGQPAPLLQELAPGLLLAAGHYRNGVLLAPASAEWVVARLEGWHGTT